MSPEQNLTTQPHRNEFGPGNNRASYHTRGRLFYIERRPNCITLEAGSDLIHLSSGGILYSCFQTPSPASIISNMATNGEQPFRAEMRRVPTGGFLSPSKRTNSMGVQAEDTRICVIMVGLPARGKSLIAQKSRHALEVEPRSDLRLTHR